MSNDTKHIFVLVAGTVDPICLTPSSIKRAASYTSSNNYWAENKAFIDKLKMLCQQHPNLALFDVHGWSGDNTKTNREIAGAYLANRLCGSNGQAAYYSGYRKKNVAFHLIGHSHGGNVLNEFTKRAAVAPEWPEQWQIKSITYLSTPFFNQLHQLDCTRFSPDCRIINVTNDFDLTQRVIADFSMYDLVSAYNLVKDDTPTLARVVNETSVAGIRVKLLSIKNKLPQSSFLRIFLNSAGYKFSKTDGREIYQETLLVLSDCRKILIELRGAVDKLSQTLYYASDDAVKRYSEESTRYFVSPSLKEELDTLLAVLIQDITNICDAIEKRNDSSDYSILPLIKDISDELNHIIDFLTLDASRASGPVVDLLFKVIDNQIEFFDNTSATPEEQLTDEFRSRLSHINITRKDQYYSNIDQGEFNDFISRLQQSEQDYELSDNQKNLLKICINLLAPQTELCGFKQGLAEANKSMDSALGSGFRRFFARSLTLWGNIKPVRKMAFRIQDLLKSYEQLLKEQHGDKTLLDEKILPGSLAHFSVVSHSVSRQDLYPEVIELLKPQFEPEITPQADEDSQQQAKAVSTDEE
ncbi:hypothetical protein [Oceanospirillum sediminis]|uniref:Alpha/beta hydrolase n=1 Tax=Oceanospirillum sediminis TaxID=2760088 RepID=A0A839IMF7_9GAMM|nr:hypothetical protein [Oceanospirillum sediminis]MBB1486138.1 hypothetical protein [Oceanospirillum sediminis]